MKKNNLHIYPIVLHLICLLTLTGSQDVQAQKNINNIENKLTAAIDSFYTANKLPGIAAEIYTPDFTYKYAVGKADLQINKDRNLTDKIRIGSITKTFVATLILQLVDESKIGLDDNLAKYYPNYPNGANITIRQMLDMTSGIPDYLADPLIGASFDFYRSNKFTPQEIYEATMSLTPTFEPGKGWHYSNGNYNILGMLVEKITGNKLEDDLNSRIIKPLGLTNTYLPTAPDISGDHASGYMTDTVTGNKVNVTIMEPSITWAAGGMISDFSDLKIYMKALYDGTLVSKQTQEERFKFVSTGIKPFFQYGLGLLYADGFIGHNGGITGYNTMMCYNPDIETMMLLSINDYGLEGGQVDNLLVMLAKTVFPGKNFFN